MDELITQIEGLLAAGVKAGTHRVELDAALVGPAVAQGICVVFVQPPTITYETFHVATASWQVLIVAGPEGDQIAALVRIMEVIDKLRIPLAIERAEPVTFNDLQGPNWPAYQLTLTTNWESI